MREAEIDNSLLEIAHRFRPRILAEADRIEASRRLAEDLARAEKHPDHYDRITERTERQNRSQRARGTD
jgi:hypothetical protein